MKKLIFQALIIVALFFTLWSSFDKIDWMTLFNIEKISNSTEEKLGDLFWDLYRKAEKEIKDEKVTIPVDSLLSKICISNGIDKDPIKIHIIKNDEINAFAMPNKHLVIYTGLISASENQAELTGVICHELAHMESNHVMKKLIKEVGLAMLISMTTGQSGNQMIREAVKLLSSTAFDRNLEREADIMAVEYLINADINPEPFANFLYRLSENESNLGKQMTWISTHPDSKERAEYIIEHSGDRIKNTSPIITAKTWEELLESMKGLQ